MKKITNLILVFAVSLTTIACSSSKETAATSEEMKTEETMTADVAETHNVLVIVNTATWCGTCKSNGPRVEEEILSKYMQDDRYQIIVNNLSDEETKTASNKNLKAAGLLDFSEKNNGTGLIYMLNAETKEFISKIGVSKSTEKIEEELNAALIS